MGLRRDGKSKSLTSVVIVLGNTRSPLQYTIAVFPCVQ